LRRAETAPFGESGGAVALELVCEVVRGHLVLLASKITKQGVYKSRGYSVGVKTFRTYYASPVSAQMSRGWRVTDVQVIAPRTLSVSEEHSLVPQADIVWREDPEGNRYEQVEKIVRDATTMAAKGLKGSRPVRLEITLTKFHAMTFEAEALRKDVGVHNVDFIIKAVDAQTGVVLAGPDSIESALPAKTGARMAAARARGESQRTQITVHVREVVAGWLGIGPDPRRTFTRVGD
jgi:hypothetical protein